MPDNSNTPVGFLSAPELGSTDDFASLYHKGVNIPQTQAVANNQLPPTPQPPATLAIAPIAPIAPTPAPMVTNKVELPPPMPPLHHVENPIVIGGKILDSKTVANSGVGTISALILFVAIWQIIQLGLHVGLTYWGNQAASNFAVNILHGQLYREYPALILILFLSLISTTLLIIATPINAAASNKAWQNVMLLISGSVGLNVIQMLLGFGQLLGMATYLNDKIGSLIEGSPYLLLWQLVWISGLLALLCLLGLLLKKKDYQDEAVEVKSMNFLAYMVLIIFVFASVGSFSIYEIISMSDKSFGANDLKKAISYRVYTVPKAPGGRVPIKTYSLNNDTKALMVGRSDFVETAFDFPLIKRAGKTQSSEITLREIQVGMPFDLTVFANNLISGAEVNEVMVSTAYEQKAMTVKDAGGKQTALAMLTPESVLILISSTKAEVGDLVAMAEALR